MFIRMYLADAVDVKELITTISLLLCVALVSPGFMLPFVFKYSVEKARMVYYVTIGVVCAVSAMLSVDMSIPDVPVYIALVIAAIFFALSCFISTKLYENREL